jgi:hypothetical protein
MTNNQSPPADPDQLREEIAQTRADLGETAAALAAKADVKARAKDAAASAKADVTARAKEAAATAKHRAAHEVALTQQQLKDGDVAAVARRPAPMALLAAVAAGAAALAIILIRRARR